MTSKLGDIILEGLHILYISVRLAGYYSGYFSRDLCFGSTSYIWFTFNSGGTDWETANRVLGFAN